MSVERGVMAIRRSAALSDGDHIATVRISGPGAYDAIDAVCPRDVYVQDGQALHTVFLDDAAHPVADVYVLADNEDFVVTGDTRSGTLIDYLRDRIPSRHAVELQNLTETHRTLSLNGPYAWEILADVLTPEIIGLPYLGFFHSDDLVCLRAGKTGEYGYDILVPHEGLARLRERIVEGGASFDLGTADLEAVDSCALENWFFNVRREGQADVTPVELQLQWRISYGRDFPGAAALRERRAVATRRATLVVADGDLSVGDTVVWGEQRIGELLAASPSHTLGGHIAVALLDAAIAHPGSSDFAVVSGNGRLPIRTVSAPPVNNRSLFVDPQRHSYRTRDKDVFPPLVPAP